MKKLIIGAGCLGQGLAKVFGERGKPYRLIHHTDNWESLVSEASIIINCAGIVGNKRCQEASHTEVLDANVYLPLALAERAKTWEIPCVLISTGAVYAKPAGVLKVERDAVKGTNLYTESKLQMEDYCRPTDATIFRLCNFIGDGSHRNDYQNRIKSWEYVVDTYVSTLHIHRFATVLSAIDEDDIGFKGQLFNIANPEFTYLPALAPDKPVLLRSDQPENASVSHILDIGKLWKTIRY